MYPRRPQLPAIHLRRSPRTPPRGARWLDELELDGYRIACIIRDGKIRLESGRNVDWTARCARRRAGTGRNAPRPAGSRSCAGLARLFVISGGLGGIYTA